MGLNLVTSAEYKAYAGISSTAQDAAINSIIPKVSELVKTLCRRAFVDYVNDAKIEITSGGYGSKLFLREYPLIAVSSLEYSYDYGASYTALEEFVDYVVDMEDATIVGITLGAFPKAINGYKITYTAGYESIPGDLKLAIMDLVTYYLRNDGAVHNSRAPNGNVQIEYITSTALPAHIKRILDQYVGSYD